MHYHHRHHHHRWQQIAVIVISFCLQIIMLRSTASAATTAAPISIGFLQSIQSTRSHNHHRRCRLITSNNNFRHFNLLGSKTTTFLRAASSQNSGSSSTSATLKTLAPITQSDNGSFYEVEEIVKKSRFIGIAVPTTSWDDARIILDQVRKDHPKSRHVCFGFISSSTTAAPSTDDESNSDSEKSDTVVGTERASDDGEPTGTAGQPILNAIKSEELSDTLCIVVRYFGGIKLGAGGLIRAYGSAARAVLRSAPTVIHIPTVRLRLVINTQYSGSVYALAARFEGVTSGETYNDRGELEVVITCEEEKAAALREEIVDATRGSVVFL